jgi:photosystem II stability/assembly factor-like uncharacterized protein
MQFSFLQVLGLLVIVMFVAFLIVPIMASASAQAIFNAYFKAKLAHLQAMLGLGVEPSERKRVQ